jgi:hypothetical protein
MNRKRSLILLISIASIVIASSAWAQVSFRVSFGTAPRWRTVEGSRVEIIGDANHPYDMFRYGGRYYVYNNDRWYSSTDWRGDFAYIDDNVVPVEIHRVPRNYWRAYPVAWTDVDRSGGGSWSGGASYGNDGYGNDGTTFRVSFNSRPSWSPVRGTQVRMIRTDNRPSYDMFQYGGRYYVYNDGRWYVSNRWRGDFQVVSVRAVPWELRKVPRRYWRDYAWSNGYYGARYDDRHDNRNNRNHDGYNDHR